MHDIGRAGEEFVQTLHCGFDSQFPTTKVGVVQAGPLGLEICASASMVVETL